MSLLKKVNESASAAGQPPPYDTASVSATRNVVQDAVIDTLPRKSLQAREEKTRRFKRYLRHILTIDYGVTIMDSMDRYDTAIDFKHYAAVTQAAIDLRKHIESAGGDVSVIDHHAEIEKLTRTVDEEIRAPAEEIDLPVEVVLLMMSRYNQPRDDSHRAVGCHRMLLEQRDGIRLLEHKIELDRAVVIPAVFPASCAEKRREILVANGAAEKRCRALRQELAAQDTVYSESQRPKSFKDVEVAPSETRTPQKGGIAVRLRNAYAAFKTGAR